MSIDFIDLLYGISHLKCRLVFTVVHTACLKGYDDAWHCECRITNSVFQGHAFWSGISPLRSYSQLHSRSPWKCVLGIHCREVWESEKRKHSFHRHPDQGAPPKPGCRKFVKSPQSEAEWRSKQSLKCHFKLTDGASTVSVRGECWSNSLTPLRNTYWYVWLEWDSDIT